MLLQRTVDTAGSAEPASQPIGIDLDVWVVTDDGLSYGSITDSPVQSFALALGAVITHTIDRGMAVQMKNDDQRLEIEGDRPNCLRAWPSWSF